MPKAIANSGRRWARTAVALLSLVPLAAGAAAAQTATEPRAATGPPYRVGGAVTRPEILSRGSHPEYTEAARKARLQGVVILETVIDERGEVRETRVLKGLPMGLDKAAIDAVRTWKFKPATFQGEPVAVYYTLTVSFQVEASAHQGVTFREFLREHPDFASAFHSERYDEAAALLDQPPAADDPRALLARVYLLLEQDLLVEAWHATLKEIGTHRGEVLRAVAIHASRLSGRSAPDSALRAQTVEIGLAAASQALEADPGDLDTMLAKVLLLRSKAAQTADPAEAQELRDEADRLSARAQQGQGAPRPEPGGA